MSLIDFILNLAGLLLWLNWRASQPIVVAPSAAGGVVMPRRIRPPRSRWWYLAGLLALLYVRAFFYWQAGAPLHWEPGLHFNSIWLVFRSDFPGRILLYSVLSFGATLGIFYMCLLLVSSVNGPSAESDPAQRWVRQNLGCLDRWPRAVKMLLPLPAMVAIWCSLNPLLRQVDLVPAISTVRLLTQGALIGLTSYLTLKFFVVGLLTMHVLSTYIYLGESHFIKFVNTTSAAMLRPWRWLPLRIGRFDLAPFALIALVLVAAEFGRRGLERLG